MKEKSEKFRSLEDAFCLPATYSHMRPCLGMKEIENITYALVFLEGNLIRMRVKCNT